MLRRLRNLVGYIRGEFIVLKVDKNHLVVDAEHFEKSKLQEVASIFFQRVYNL
jgi:hypothetical protein